ncbi:hypothetical protein [Empedobacter brevis]|uniref:hypothetical protein n=1 Tax=Empedobacter brevis TaxID=247 RepID=UPI0039B0FCA7
MYSSLTNINFLFTKKNDRSWIFEHSEKYFIVSDEIKSLLEILKRNQYNLDKSYNEFIEEFDYVSNDDFHSIVEQNLNSLELNVANEEIKKKKSFIRFETKIISKENAARISKVLQPLFQPTFFWITFTLLFLFSIYNLTQIKHINFEKDYMLYLFVFYLISALIHEFGHIAACNRFAKKNGEIGIGVYFIFPVFYSNITPIWSVKKQERIITNLAGVYIQLFTILGLFIVYLISGNNHIKDIIAITTMVILYQLIPFIRTDGYWILSDITETPNLLTVSSKKVKDFFRNPLKLKLDNKKELFFLIYGLFNQLIMFYLIINIIITYKYQLITGPIELVKIALKHPKELINYLNVNIELIFISIIFYLILFNLIKRVIKK